MAKLILENIKKIYLNLDKDTPGYILEFQDGKKIYFSKKRTIIALLVLIKKGIGSESDLAKGSTTIPEIQKNLKGKIPDKLIQDYYGDANKPFSELWNEEGFSWITNIEVEKQGKSKGYQLKDEDHERFFGKIIKANRKAPTYATQEKIKEDQKGLCNICGTQIHHAKKIESSTFAKDRVREVCDHRFPVEKGGPSTELDNYQMLCFSCNKSKWQVCNICDEVDCKNCALAYPEKTTVIYPTQEDISDRMANRDKYLPLLNLKTL